MIPELYKVSMLCITFIDALVPFSVDILHSLGMRKAENLTGSLFIINLNGEIASGNTHERVHAHTQTHTLCSKSNVHM